MTFSGSPVALFLSTPQKGPLRGVGIVMAGSQDDVVVFSKYALSDTVMESVDPPNSMMRSFPTVIWQCSVIASGVDDPMS